MNTISNLTLWKTALLLKMSKYLIATACSIDNVALGREGAIGQAQISHVTRSADLIPKRSFPQT